MSNFYAYYPPSANVSVAGHIDVNLFDAAGNPVNLGQQLMAASLPVVIASNQTPITVTNASVGLTGAPVPASADYIGFNTPGGNLSGVTLTAAGALPVGQTGGPWTQNLTEVGGAALALGQTTMAASLPVAIASNQSAIPENLTEVGGSAIALGQAAMAASLPVVIASNQTDLPVNIDEYGGVATTLGQKLSAASMPVVLASDQSIIPTSNASVGATGAPVPADATYIGFKTPGGNLSGVTLTAAGALPVDGSATTQPVNLTEVGGAAIALGQAAMAASVPVVIASNQTPVSENITEVGGSAITLGQKTEANSFPVTIASDQSAVPANITEVGGAALALGQMTAANSVPVVLASNQPAIPTASPVNTNGSTVTSLVIGSGATVTFAPPANAVGFILEASSSNVVNLRWGLVTAPTTTTGMRLEPGRDSGFIPAAANVLVIAESGGATNEADITWVKSS